MYKRAHFSGLLLMVLLFGLGAEASAQDSRPAPVKVLINEVLASNNHTIHDPQGQYDDWLELYNAGRDDVEVSGFYLTDDLTRPTKWQLPPATTIPSGGYLLVWADGDITAPGLHAGFRLNDEGEEVGLFAADGVTLLDSIFFGPQRTDVSYGRYPDGGSTWRAMAVPTPGAANNDLYDGIVEPPQADVKSALCPRPVTVTLTTATEGATIYYTLDGRSPLDEARGVPAGVVYSAPISVTKAVTLRAIAWKSGWRQSDEMVERYVFLGADVRSFSSPLPLAVIDTAGKGISRSPTSAYSFFIDLGAAGRAALTDSAGFSGPATIHVRGESSGGFDKQQYHFETTDDRGDGKDVSILGFPPESDWVLQGQYSDKTLMRNTLPYQWSNELGRWAAHTRFIEMFLNKNDGTVTMADYVGVYVFMEKIKISPSRVNITELEPSDNAEPEVSGGYIIRKDKTGGETFTTSRGQTLTYFDPSGTQLTSAQKAWIRSYVNSFEAVLYGPNFKDPVVGYARFIDVGSFIDNHILVELTKNIDGFRLSTYYFKDRNGKLNMGPIWDYDLSLGNANYLNGWLPTGWYNVQLGEGDYPYWRRLFEDPEFKIRYADRWFAVRRDLFATARLLGIIEDYATLLDEPAQRNFDKWRILGVYVWPNWYIGKTYREEVTWMKGWLSDRLRWLDSQIAAEFAPAPPTFSRQGGHVEADFPLALSGSGTIFYTVDGSDPRLFLGPIVPLTVTTLVPENAGRRVLVPTADIGDAWRSGGPFDDSAWMPATGGVGFFDRGSPYRAFVRLDLKEQMYKLWNSCYMRLPFVFPRDVQNVVSLTLKIRYDDGFVAYLNGTEIARRNCPGVPAWNSTASAANPEDMAVILQEIPVANPKSLLRPGVNLLALQGMNVFTTSADLLISFELTAEETTQFELPAGGGIYAGPLSLGASGWVKARSFTDGRWSALNEALFAVGPVAESLRLTELMYHPAETGNPDDPNTEYLELTNIGAQPINLHLVRFTDGIDFTFPRFELAPGGYCLVVQDAAAFAARYGPGLPVVGQYTGSLSNGGERLELQDAAGRIIHAFEYSDGWYSATDGRGFSLTLKNPATVDPNALGEAGNWRASARSGGSPGLPDLP
jgi:hypothetical protein